MVYAQVPSALPALALSLRIAAPGGLASIIHPQQPGPSRLMNGAVRLGKWGCGGRPRRP
jgi:hypothetical protein